MGVQVWLYRDALSAGGRRPGLLDNVSVCVCVCVFDTG